jgi:hypothetical protein
LLIGHLYSKVRQKREVPSAALASSNHSAPREVGLSTLKPILRFVKSILLFVLTYYLGAVCPPRTVPQTMIAIAKKTGSAQEFVNLPA